MEYILLIGLCLGFAFLVYVFIKQQEQREDIDSLQNQINEMKRTVFEAEISKSGRGQAPQAGKPQKQVTPPQVREAPPGYLPEQPVYQPVFAAPPDSAQIPVKKTGPAAPKEEKPVIKAQAEEKPAAPKTEPTALSEEKKKFSSITEGWIGRNVFAIAASLLIFVGLIFLGRLIYEHITDEIKIVLTFAISAVITALGAVLSVRAKNTFTVILTGCGCGSFFISIMLTHLYFDRLGSTAAGIVLLVWMAASLFLAKKIDSVSLSVVAHIGMIISTCAAYAMSLSDEKLMLLLIYQMAAIAVIAGGNILCCKKTYRFGLFISLALTLVGSAFMWAEYNPGAYSTAYLPFVNTNLSILVISAAFIAQFAGASFLSYLL
ncbi:MAG: DUF2339 domain-containing protein, partial [Oscillospiraceae bacterium]|nr:DUF2339 domain-containing protein [Oscillospiraceae bacterium]